jgi:hypothetical protein
MYSPKVRAMRSTRSGNPVPNQYIIHTDEGTYFQSSDVIVGFSPRGINIIHLDDTYWDWSRTTSKYMYIWLRGHGVNHTSAEMKKAFNGDGLVDIIWRDLNL